MSLYDYLQYQETSTNGIDLYNIDKINWNEFRPSNGSLNVYFLEVEDVYKPYLISMKVYNIIGYTDMILLFNKVLDPFTLSIGQKLIIPKLFELQIFLEKQMEK